MEQLDQTIAQLTPIIEGEVIFDVSVRQGVVHNYLSGVTCDTMGVSTPRVFTEADRDKLCPTCSWDIIQVVKQNSMRHLPSSSVTRIHDEVQQWVSNATPSWDETHEALLTYQYLTMMVTVSDRLEVKFFEHVRDVSDHLLETLPIVDGWVLLSSGRSVDQTYNALVDTLGSGGVIQAPRSVWDHALKTLHNTSNRGDALVQDAVLLKKPLDDDALRAVQALFGGAAYPTLETALAGVRGLDL